MNEKYYARRAELQLKYEKKDISADLAPHLVGFSYTDHASGKADDLQITLDDREGLWRGAWFPDKGAMLTAVLIARYWESLTSQQQLPLGTFEIDEIECSGAPYVVTIKAVSVPESASLRGQDKTRAWEKTTLKTIAADIAGGAGMELLYETADDPKYDRREQTEESDLAFLQKLCNDAGLSLKVTAGQIVIFDDAKYESMDPVATITRNESDVSNFRGTSSLRDSYSACRVKYHNARKKQDVDYTFTPTNRPATGKTLVINEKVASIAEAETLAKKKLREKNKDEVKVSMTLPGNVLLVGGVTVALSGWGTFDGKYFIEQANHDVGGSGYTTKIDLRKVLEGY